MRTEKEIFELIPCTSNVYAQFENENDGIDLIPVEMYARCLVTYNSEDECEDCEEDYCEGCIWEDCDPEVLVLPMIVMNDEFHPTFADDYDNYVGMKRL